MPEISTPGSSRTSYRKMGAGPALVLIHGFPGSGDLWRYVWDDLAPSATLIILDLPGTGNSLLEKETGIGVMADSIKAIIDAEGIDRVIIAGHSMGGYIGFEFAARYPERLAGLSLVHSVPTDDDDEKKKLRLRSIALISKGGRNVFITQMIPSLFSEAFKQTHPEVVEQQIQLALQLKDDALINFYQAMIARKDHSQILETAVFPVQWIAGIADNVIHYKRILAHCHTSRVNFVNINSDCGHMSMLETPGQLVASLKDFINYCYGHAI